MTGTVLRVKGGRPAGGEYAAHERQEANIELSNDADLETQDYVPDPNHGRVFNIPAENLAAAMAQIDKANRRLERAGVDARFTAETEIDSREINGRRYEYVRMMLNEPRLGFEGWTFTGAHQFTADDKVISFGKEAPEVTDAHCDHCGKNRRRESVYTLHSETEGDKQVGKSCLTAFLGVKPEGLWALESRIDLAVFEEPDDPDWSPSPASQVFDAEELIIAALAASNDGKDFISRGAASMEDRATADEVLMGFNALLATETPARAARAKEILAWVSAIPEDADSDYLINLRQVIGGERRIVKAKHVALAVSAIGAIDFERQLAEAKAARLLREKNKVRAYLAAPKEKLEGIKATVISTKTFEGMHYNTYTTLVKLRGADGHTITWFASGVKDYKDGTEVNIKATVKANEEFNGEWQTVITRAKLTDPETGETLGTFNTGFVEEEE
jgi:hypothetical protein